MNNVDATEEDEKTGAFESELFLIIRIAEQFIVLQIAFIALGKLNRTKQNRAQRKTSTYGKVNAQVKSNHDVARAAFKAIWMIFLSVCRSKFINHCTVTCRAANLHQTKLRNAQVTSSSAGHSRGLPQQVL